MKFAKAFKNGVNFSNSHLADGAIVKKEAYNLKTRLVSKKPTLVPVQIKKTLRTHMDHKYSLALVTGNIERWLRME